MSLAISTKTIRVGIGTEFRPRVTVRLKSTRAAVDLSTYSVQFAVKASPDETTTYLVDPISGTGDSSGHLDATVPETTMDDLAEGDAVGEFAASVGGEVKIRVQFPIHVEPRVIVPDPTP